MINLVFFRLYLEFTKGMFLVCVYGGIDIVITLKNLSRNNNIFKLKFLQHV